MFERCTRDVACEKAGITERALYLALAKPEVARHWNAELDVLRTGERLANFRRLVELRDQDAHKMAAVTAIKTLEESAAAIPPGGAQPTTPGLVIVVVRQDGAKETLAPAIDVTPPRQLADKLPVTNAEKTKG